MNPARRGLEALLARYPAASLVAAHAPAPPAEQLLPPWRQEAGGALPPWLLVTLEHDGGALEHFAVWTFNGDVYRMEAPMGPVLDPPILEPGRAGGER